MSLDPQTAALLERLNAIAAAPPAQEVDSPIAAARAAARAMWLEFAGDVDDACDVRAVHIGTDGREIPIRFYSPGTRAGKRLPVVAFFHGGGWSIGDLDCYDGLMRDLAGRSGAIFVSVDYRLAPEHPFPAGLEDCLAAVRWLRQNAAEISGDGARLAVMGDSAGGNLATVVARRLHGEGDVRLVGQFLIYPVLDVSRPHEAFPSRMAYGDGDLLLSRAAIDETAKWYLDGRDLADDPEISPLLLDDLSAMPPTVIIAAGCDPLRSENEQYAARLKAAGVATRLICLEGAIHAFMSFGVLDIARDAREMLAGEVRRVLFSGR